jgi:branched-chain amino acid transport system substrate-binding protein
MADQLESYLNAKLGDELGRRDFIKVGATTAGMLAIAACGGQPTSSASPSAATGPDFKIGIVLPYSAVYADLGDSITKGMQLYFDKVGNTAGGRKIVILKEDEQTGTQPAQDKTKKLVEQDNVNLITGYVQSPAIAAVVPYLTAQKMPTLVSNAGANAVSRANPDGKPDTGHLRSPFVYRTSFSNWQPSHPMGKYVAETMGVKKVTLVYANYSAGQESVSSFRETYTGTIVQEVKTPFPNVTGDFSSSIAQIQAQPTEAVYVFLSGTDAQQFLKQAATAKLFANIKVSGSGFFVEQDVLSAIGDAAPVNAITGLHWALTLDNRENKDFTDSFKKRNNKTADVFAVQGYDTARVIVDALNVVKGKTDSPDQFLKAIAAVKFNSPRGTFKFDPVTNNVINTIYIRKLIKDPTLGYTNQVLQTVPDVADPGK